MSSKGWAGLVGKTVDWDRKIGDGAPSEHPSQAIYPMAVCVLGSRKVCVTALGSHWQRDSMDCAR